MRKEKIITLNDRGNELKFRIVEMSARKLESWLIRAGLLLVGSGAFDNNDVTNAEDAIRKAGAFLSRNGISALAKIDYDKAQPLLDELLACCYNISGGVNAQLTPDTIDSIIEDVRTLFELQRETVTLNIGFFLPDKKSDTHNKLNQSQGSQKPKISVH